VSLPQLYTARYAAERVLASGRAVPVRVGFAPIVPISTYALSEVAESLVPSRETIVTGGGEWRPMSRAYWRQLNRTGPERIGEELAGISERHGGKALVLVSEDDLEKGHRDLRVVAAAWLEEHTGRRVYELTADGRKVHYKELPKRVQPKRPKQHDERWTHGKEPIREWPLSEDDLRAWVRARHWQFAKTTPGNPHEYTHRDWGDEKMFLQVIRHIREHGRQEAYGGDTYTVLDLDEHFYWSMGDPTYCTIILNRKYHDQEKQAELAEEQTGRSREELGLAPAVRRDRAHADPAAPLEGLFDLEEDG
jgi:hypothetical protein